jgi:hypothetical protein
MKPADRACRLCPEVELLVGSARVSLPTEWAERLSALLRAGLDWGRLVRLAEAHRTAALLSTHLEALGAGLVPDSVKEPLRSLLQAEAVRALWQAKELGDIVRELAGEGIAALPFKGPTLAQLAYRNLALRPCGDLDILVSRRQVWQACRVLGQRGYQPADGLTPRQQELHLSALGQLPLERPSDGVVVELHTEWLPRAFGFGLTPQAAWQRRRVCPLPGAEVPSLAAEDLLLLLCAHGAKHRWERLLWVCDVAELLRSCPELDWEALWRRGRQLHMGRMLCLGLFLAAQTLQAPLPDAFARHVGSEPGVASLARQVCERLEREPGDPESTLGRCWFYLRVRERPADGVRYVLNLALAPTSADWVRHALPAPLGWLYYLLRPLRLAGKYAARLWRRGG